jgi:TolB-like protein/Flp pilus assembly protein TadD
VGTLSYLAPEQIEGKRADARTDIFAFGVILYEMATGKKPFAGTSKASLIASILTGVPPPIGELAPMTPPALDRLIRQCLEKDPDERWHSVHDVVKELKWIRDAGPAAVRAESATTFAKRPSGMAWLIAGVVVAALLATIVLLHPWRSTAGGALGPPSPKRIAVLPFENQGPPETDYFAEGMSDEVRGKLASLPSLVVVASTTSSQYKKTAKPIEQVARELDARYLVVGKVRWEKAAGEGRVQVVPELVEVEPGGAQTEKWRQAFEASLTDVFHVQAEIAEKVARSLDVALSARQQSTLAERPTGNLAAYDAFLRGEMAYRRGGRMAEAATAYEQAVRLDPSFALAWAHLSRAHAARYEFHPTPGGAKAAREAAERAIALAPERPDGYVAHSQYYAQVEGDCLRALPEIERAERLAPRDVDVLNRRARLERNLGRWEESVRISQEAKHLDPGSIITAKDFTDTLTPMRRYAEAQAEADRALALDPTDSEARVNRALVSLSQGDLPGARALLGGASAEIDRVTLEAIMISLAPWVLDEAQQRRALTFGPDQFSNDRAAWALSRAEIYWLRGDTAKSRENAEVARVEHESQLRAVPPGAAVWGLRIGHALALAYLGQKSAITEGERAAALRPSKEDALWGPTIEENLVTIYLLFGENEKALDRIEMLLKIPSDLSPGWLRIDPTFAPLRGNPRFEKLLKGSP